MKTFIKKKENKVIGFKNPVSFRGKIFGKTSQAKFNPGTFKVQHKG